MCPQYASAYTEFRDATADAQTRIRRLLSRLPVFGGEQTRGDAALALLKDPDDAEVRAFDRSKGRLFNGAQRRRECQTRSIRTPLVPHRL